MSTVSVVMTTYNGGEFILKQLESLLEQSYKIDEVIICDDKSSDNTVSIVKDFIKSNSLNSWQLYENEVNLGYIKNFKKALSFSKGDIIFLCDQDDIWHKDKVKIMSSLMEKNVNITALACSYKLINADGEPYKGDEEKFYKAKGKEKLTKVNYGSSLYYNIAQGCAEAYRKSVVKTYLESPSDSLLPHDWALNIISYENKGLYFLNEDLLYYRIHSNNTTGISDSGSDFNERIPRLKKYASFMAECSSLKIKNTLPYSKLSEFTNRRVEFLERKKLSFWIKTFFKSFSLHVKPMFFPFIKDFFLVIAKKIP